MKNLLLLLVASLAAQALAAEEIPRSEFVGHFANVITGQLCHNERSPLRAIYEGDPAAHDASHV